MELHAITYLVHIEDENTKVTIEAALFENGKPTKWIVKKNFTSMFKLTGIFHYDSNPPRNDKEYQKHYWFNTPEEALKCWEKYNC